MSRKKQNAPGGANANVRAIEPLAMSIADAAKAAGVSRSFLYKLIGEGRGPKVRGVRGRRIVLAPDHVAWLANLGEVRCDPSHQHRHVGAWHDRK